MRPTLARWIGDADAARYRSQLTVEQEALEISQVIQRADDYYVALVGELFDRLRRGYQTRDDWARLGNAFGQYAAGLEQELFPNKGVSTSEARLLSATAFYFGGFPASAYVTIREGTTVFADDASRAAVDLLARRPNPDSDLVRRLREAVRIGDSETISTAVRQQEIEVAGALKQGPTEWATARVLQQLLVRFAETNVRAVLPEGASELWSPFVNSLMSRTPPVWDYFPSQIAALQKGLLERAESFSLQMPTGAGKTALCETLIYWEMTRQPDKVAILLVPYRSLASELRRTLVKRLNALGIHARCAYGGTVPSGDEVRSLADTKVLVATPESLSGLLTADPDFLRRVSLVICDEGHLLDGGSRGVGLELLLARLKARDAGPPRFIFISAVVPNIEEINLWLGGTRETVVESDYRPATAEYALLKGVVVGRKQTFGLVMHPHEEPPLQYVLPAFLSAADFQFRNARTGRVNTYSFGSVKTRAVAAARKSLPLGAVALFAANKRGDQGAIGLAEELLAQLNVPLPLPIPHTDNLADRLAEVVDYLAREYGPLWVGTRTLAVGAVLHHGDIPQETREALEKQIRLGTVRLAICTNTLAEGVNLPIRTMVLYSVHRRRPAGPPERMLARDIKNLVGRAGRAGSTTKGLVICANEDQWPLVRRVARQEPGERVAGALFRLLRALREALVAFPGPLTNTVMEESPDLFPLVDGIDATIVDLAADELGEDQLVALAARLADQTFAYQQSEPGSKRVLDQVFELRARRVHSVRSQGRLTWIRESGTRVRTLGAVEDQLLPSWDGWSTVNDSSDPNLYRVLMNWAWQQPEIRAAVRDSYRIDDDAVIDQRRESFQALVSAWLDGRSYSEIAAQGDLGVDDALGVLMTSVGFALQTLIEQAVALLSRLLESQGRPLAGAVSIFPTRLRFGVPSSAASILMQAGLRHRRAAVALGSEAAVQAIDWAGSEAILAMAQELLDSQEALWMERLGAFVYKRTVSDVTLALL